LGTQTPLHILGYYRSPSIICDLELRGGNDHHR